MRKLEEQKVKSSREKRVGSGQPAGCRLSRASEPRQIALSLPLPSCLWDGASTDFHLKFLGRICELQGEGLST